MLLPFFSKPITWFVLIALTFEIYYQNIVSVRGVDISILKSSYQKQ